MLRLSRRLEMIARQVPPDTVLADIGSDHALLPSYLAQRGTIRKAIAGEVNPGPFQAAAKQVKDSDLGSLIEVRLGDGLAVIAPGEADVITIAGMGGALIASILEAGSMKLAGVSMLILQPNVGEAQVREWLLKHNWVLTGEQILKEDGKIYEILTAVPAEKTDLTNEELYESSQLSGEVYVDRNAKLKFGPYLLRQPSEAWFDKWNRELDKLDKIRRRLAQSELAESRDKEREIVSEMKQIREVMTCLQKDKASSN